MATIEQLQKQLDDKTLDPNAFSAKQRAIIDKLIDKGALQGPKTNELMALRGATGKKLAREEEYYKDPIQVAAREADIFGLRSGQASFELAGDLTGSIAPYAVMRKKIYGGAKSGNLWNKGPGYFVQQAAKLGDKLPGRFKFLGSVLKTVARAADVPAKVIQSPLGRAEVYSVLGGSAGAGTAAVSYDLLNETVGQQIAGAISDDLATIPRKEIDRDTLTNAAYATRNALLWNSGAAALSPFIFGPLGKLGRKLFGTVGPEQAELAKYARDKGLPIPLMSAMKQGQGWLGGMGQTYFKTVGVFPFVSGIGREALQGAEQAAGRQYLNDLVAYSPLLKTSILSTDVYGQINKVFSDNIDLIASKYKAFDALATTSGNPKAIKLLNTQKAANDFLDSVKGNFPEFDIYTTRGNLPIKDIDKVLTSSGDPLNLFMQATAAIKDGMITPKQYKGLITMLNRAIEGSGYKTLKAEVWAMREAMENDFNAFGGMLNKGTMLQDEGIKATYEALAKQNPQAAEAFIANNIAAAEKLRDKLYDANNTFSSILGFYQRAKVPQILKQFDRTLFTQKGVNGIYGMQNKFRDQIFETLERDVFASNSPKALEQFAKLIGAEGAPELGIKATAGGKALLKAAKSRYMFNAFLDSFDTASTPQAQSIFKNVLDESADVKAGTQYAQDAMGLLSKEQRANLPDFSLDSVRLRNGIYDVTDIRFSPNDFASFNINKFLNKLGIGSATEELGRQKMIKMLGANGASDFFKFTNYMKAISDVPLSDTSTFLQRRMTLGSFGSVAGGMFVGAGMFTVNPLAPAIFLLLARRAGRILTDPTALRYMNDALLPEELVKGLKGKKIGPDNNFSIRSVNSKLTALGLTQKREAFARLFNYLNEEDKDVPRVNPKNIDPEAISKEILNMSYRIPQPKYDDKNLPKETVESMFVQDFTSPSGDTVTDNEMVSYMNTSVANEEAVENDEAERERTSVMGDIGMEDLQSPVGVGAQPTVSGQQAPQSEQLQSLFPFDTTSIAAAKRREQT